MQTVLSFNKDGKKSLAFRLDASKTSVDQSKRPKLTLTSLDQVLAGAPYNPVWFTFDRDPRLAESSSTKLASHAVGGGKSASSSRSADADGSAGESCDDILARLRRNWRSCNSGGDSGSAAAGSDFVRLLGNRIEPTDAMLRGVLAPLLGCTTLADVRRLNQHLLSFRRKRCRTEVASVSRCTACDNGGEEASCQFECLIAAAIHRLWFVQLPKLSTASTTHHGANWHPQAGTPMTADDFDVLGPNTQTFGTRVFVFDDEFPLHVEPLTFQAPAPHEPCLTLGATLSTPSKFYEVADNDDIHLYVPLERRVRLPRPERHRILFGNTSAHFAQVFRQFMPTPPCDNPSQMFLSFVHNLPPGCSSMQEYVSLILSSPHISSKMRQLISSVRFSDSPPPPPPQQTPKQSRKHETSRTRARPPRSTAIRAAQTGDGVVAVAAAAIPAAEAMDVDQYTSHVIDLTDDTPPIRNRKKRARRTSDEEAPVRADAATIEMESTPGDSPVAVRLDGPPPKKRRRKVAPTEQRPPLQQVHQEQHWADELRTVTARNTNDPVSGVPHAHSQYDESTHLYHQTSLLPVQQDATLFPLADTVAHRHLPVQFTEELCVTAGATCDDTGEWQREVYTETWEVPGLQSAPIDHTGATNDGPFHASHTNGTESFDASNHLTGVAMAFDYGHYSGEDEQYDQHQQLYYALTDVAAAQEDHRLHVASAFNAVTQVADHGGGGGGNCTENVALSDVNNVEVTVSLDEYPHWFAIGESTPVQYADGDHQAFTDYHRSSTEDAYTLTAVDSGEEAVVHSSLAHGQGVSTVTAAATAARRRGRTPGQTPLSLPNARASLDDVQQPAGASKPTTTGVPSKKTRSRTAPSSKKSGTNTPRESRVTKGGPAPGASVAPTKALQGTPFWADRESLAKLKFICREAWYVTNTTPAGRVYVEQNASKVRGIGLYMHLPENLAGLLRRFVGDTFMAKLKSYLASSPPSPHVHRPQRDELDPQEHDVRILVFNYRTGLEEARVLPKKSQLYEWCILMCAFAAEPFKTYLVRFMLSVLDRHRREVLGPVSAEEDRIFAALTRHRDMTKAARVSGVQHQQILDAYYWSFLSEVPDLSQLRILQYYSMCGVQARLKNDYSRTGLHTGRDGLLGVTREYAPHRRESYLMAKRIAASKHVPPPLADAATANAITQTSSMPPLPPPPSSSSSNKRRKTTQSKYVMRARQSVQTPFTYDLLGIASQTKRALLVRPPSAPMFVLNAKHHIGKSVEEVLPAEALRLFYRAANAAAGVHETATTPPSQSTSSPACGEDQLLTLSPVWTTMSCASSDSDATLAAHGSVSPVAAATSLDDRQLLFGKDRSSAASSLHIPELVVTKVNEAYQCVNSTPHADAHWKSSSNASVAGPIAALRDIGV